MHEATFLRELVLILVVAVAVVWILRSIGLPTVAGFILSGVILGPGALALVRDIGHVQLLAEVGVVLLLFGIGLELSLDRMKRLWRPILIGGAIQVTLTIVVTVVIAVLLGYPRRAAIVLGFILSVSSTAIILRALHSRGELEAPHGRLALGILLFQDLCVVPMLLAIPLLEGATPAARWQTVMALGKAGAVLLGVLVGARILVPRALDAVARTRQRELFILAVLTVCLGTAWLVSLIGVSLALGAFLAGLVVAGSQYRHQALSDVIPVREVLTSVFFISIGMLLDPAELAAAAVPICTLLAAILVGKFVIVALTGLILRMSVRGSILAGAALAQVGEFAFVIASATEKNGLLEQPLRGQLLAAVIISMFIAPLMLALGPRLAAGMNLMPRLTRLLEVRTAAETAGLAHEHSGHVVIGGYGVAGRALARALADSSVPYVILETDADKVRQALAEGLPACFGDVTSQAVLEHLNLAQARELVLAINDPRAVARAIAAARAIAPGVHILARTPLVADAAALEQAGVDEIVFSEVEAALQITELVLARHAVDSAVIHRERSDLRAQLQGTGDVA